MEFDTRYYVDLKLYHENRRLRDYWELVLISFKALVYL